MNSLTATVLSSLSKILTSLVDAAKSCMIQSTCCNTIQIIDDYDEERQALLSQKIINISHPPEQCLASINWEKIQKDILPMIRDQ